jgi:hypothetical protein
MNRYYVVEPCNSAGGFEIKLRNRRLDLKKCEAVLDRMGSVAGNSGVVILAKVGGLVLSVYGSGRIMVKPGSGSRRRKPRKAEVEALAGRLIEALEKEGALA